jgi:hypothetical protein
MKDERNLRKKQYLATDDDPKPASVFTKAEFAAFVAGVRNGEFDHFLK